MRFALRITFRTTRGMFGHSVLLAIRSTCGSERPDRRITGRHGQLRIPAERGQRCRISWSTCSVQSNGNATVKHYLVNLNAVCWRNGSKRGAR